ELRQVDHREVVLLHRRAGRVVARLDRPARAADDRDRGVARRTREEDRVDRRRAAAGGGTVGSSEDVDAGPEEGAGADEPAARAVDLEADDAVVADAAV